MRVLLLIGNGFDINLGMPTSYQSFLKYYLKSNSSDRNENIERVKSQISEDITTWSDLEYQLGQATSGFEKPTDFLDVYLNIRDELEKYLSVVENGMLQTIPTNITNQFCYDLQQFYEYFDIKQRNLWNGYSKLFNTEKMQYDIITFNYTSTIEKIIEFSSDHSLAFGSVNHIHQTLEEGILMGVDTEHQISNVSFRNIYDIDANILKPYINNEYDDGIDKKCAELIERADSIIMFGLSMGHTDATWWHKIGLTMHKKNIKLVYCPYDTVKLKRKSDILMRNHNFVEFIVGRLSARNPNINIRLDDVLPIRENRMFDFGISSKDVEENYAKLFEK